MAQEELEVEELDNILDSSWIDDFKRQDKEYERYYTDNIHKIKIHSIFININNDIIQIKEEKIKLKQPNYISREEIIGLLKRNTNVNNKKYSVLSILKCNITLKPEEIKNFLKSSNLTDYLDNFLVPIKNIDAITFEKTINMFQDLNDLLFIFYEKSDEELKRSINNVTKKVYLNQKTNHKNTIRKQYKDT